MCTKYDVMPFSLRLIECSILLLLLVSCFLWVCFVLVRSFEEEGKARMGVVECLNHNLVEAFHILHEKEG